jgi:hypothetical protein
MLAQSRNAVSSIGGAMRQNLGGKVKDEWRMHAMLRPGTVEVAKV